jgi:hypothetical protein
MSEKSKTLVIDHPDQFFKVSTRRSFLKMLGVGGSIVLMPAVFAACGDNNSTTGTITNPPGGGTTTADPVTLNLSNDFGILNYAYALEQLEAAFYTAVVSSSLFSAFGADHQEVLVDLRNHEIIHREFLKAALGSNALPALTLNASAVAQTMTSTLVVLKSAETFEDLGVSAYNGAGKYLKDAGYLTIAGKIVSVEARHAAAIRDIRDILGEPRGSDAPYTRFAGDSVSTSSSSPLPFCRRCSRSSPTSSRPRASLRLPRPPTLRRRRRRDQPNRLEIITS